MGACLVPGFEIVFCYKNKENKEIKENTFDSLCFFFILKNTDNTVNTILKEEQYLENAKTFSVFLKTVFKNIFKNKTQTGPRPLLYAGYLIC